MSASPPLAEDQHRGRARRHLVIGEALEESGDEWAAVPLFYAAYHHVKAAMLKDPVWSSPQTLHALNFDLVPNDKFTTRHHGRKQAGGGRQWGINELVMLLYPGIVKEYERLHQASIQVRYGAGLPAGALPDLRRCINHICDQNDRGLLVAATSS